MRLIRIMGLTVLCLVASGCEQAREAAQVTQHQYELQTALTAAQHLHDNGQSLQAIESFKKVVDDPALSQKQKSESLRYISLGYYELGDFVQSGNYAAKAAATYPEGSYDYLVNMADADLMLERVPQAIVRLEAAIKMAPNKLPANNVLGLLYLGDNGPEYVNYEKGLAFNRAAFEIAPGRITEIVLARNLIKLKRYPEAEAHLSNVRKTHPDDQRVLSLLAQARQGMAQGNSVQTPQG